LSYLLFLGALRLDVPHFVTVLVSSRLRLFSISTEQLSGHIH
jgi:hypothetical protein